MQLSKAVALSQYVGAKFQPVLYVAMQQSEWVQSITHATSTDRQSSNNRQVSYSEAENAEHLMTLSS
jgi:hypothetical protein